jgi:acyl phosphate:glycerol-3-phosphate acyltransferase
LVEIILILFGYLLGSVPTGFILGWMAGVDVRKAGSGNVGATNVARVAGKRQGFLTLIGDTAKGVVPVILALQLGANLTTTVMAGAAAFVGHLYPVFLKFRGGKGVATALGVFVALAPVAALVLILMFIAIALSSRIVSVGSIATAMAAPLILWLFSYPPIVVGMAVFIAAAITLRHRSNIQRLLKGTEPRFGSANSR